MKKELDIKTYLCAILIIAILIGAVWIAVDSIGGNNFKSSAHNSVREKWLKAVVEESVDRWISLPYTNAPIKSFMSKLGKSFYALELSYSERGMICPFGAVSRNIEKELGIYAINVQIPLAGSARQIYESNAGSWQLAYANKDTNTVAVLLTLSEDWKSLEVAELTFETVGQNLFRPLDELECVVVFDVDFICLRNRGEDLFRGYKLLPNPEMRDAKSAKWQKGSAECRQIKVHSRFAEVNATGRSVCRCRHFPFQVARGAGEW